MQCKIFFFSEKNLKISKYHFSLISGTHSSVSWRDLSDSCQPPLVTGGSQVSTRTSIFLIEFSSTVANHILMEIIAAERGSIKVSGSWHGVTSPAGWRLLTLLADISESSGGQFYVYSGNTINEMCLLSKDKILVKITTLYHTGQTFPPALLNHLPHPLHVLPPVLPIQLGRQVVDRGGGVGVAQQGLDTDWSAGRSRRRLESFGFVECPNRCLRQGVHVGVVYLTLKNHCWCPVGIVLRELQVQFEYPSLNSLKEYRRSPREGQPQFSGNLSADVFEQKWPTWSAKWRCFRWLTILHRTLIS